MWASSSFCDLPGPNLLLHKDEFFLKTAHCLQQILGVVLPQLDTLIGRVFIALGSTLQFVACMSKLYLACTFESPCDCSAYTLLVRIRRRLAHQGCVSHTCEHCKGPSVVYTPCPPSTSYFFGSVIKILHRSNGGQILVQDFSPSWWGRLAVLMQVDCVGEGLIFWQTDHG